MTDADDISTNSAYWPYGIQTLDPPPYSTFREDEPMQPEHNQGRQCTEAVERSGQQMSREDLLSGVCAQLMARMDPPLTTIKLDSFAVEAGKRVEIHPDHATADHKQYVVSLRPGGGS